MRMRIMQSLQGATDALTVKRVFGDPYEKDGLTVIPAALVIGGGGGGGGTDEKGQEGEGGGFGVIARPAGAYVIKDGEVRWRPAIDPHRVLLVLALVVVASLRRRRADRS
jgi:uncharacterized spore protein YtfJ